MSTQITRPWLRPFMAGLCFVSVITGSFASGTVIKSQLDSYKAIEAHSKWRDEMDQGLEAFYQTAYPLADSHFRVAINLCKQDSDEYIETARCLGVTLYNEQQDIEALGYLQKALKLTRKRLKHESLDLGGIMFWNARVLERVGQYPEAEKLYLETLAIYKENTGPLSFEYINTAVDYANFLCLLNRFDEALPIAQEAYLVDMQDCGLHNANTLQAGKCLAKVYNRLRRFDEAETLLNQNLELSRQIYGEKTQQTAQCYLELANHCSAAKDFERANLLYNGIIDMLKVAIGYGEITLIDTELGYARSLEAENKMDQAQSWLNKCRTHAATRYGANHPITQNIENELLSLKQ